MTKPLALLCLSLATAAFAQQEVAATKHNLSLTGPGPVKASNESQICVFCHVPHRGGARGTNRPESSATYQPYSSSTQVAPPPGVLGGASRTCLSCHDGTIAPGQTLASGTIALAGTGAGGKLNVGASNLGTDLRLSHPISINSPLTTELREPAAGDAVKLTSAGRLECTSCHDPHQNLDPVEGKFLVKSNRGAALCLTCHVKGTWLTNSVHQSSIAAYDRSLGATTPYATVTENGCMACHVSHNSKTSARLLKEDESRVCTTQCHNGAVAAKDLRLDLTKPYAHPTPSTDPLIHDDAEGPASATHPLPETNAATPRHAECVDCHNPHATNATTATAPRANGALAGVWGIDRNGMRVDPVQFQYEVCFKCHGTSANRPQRNGPSWPVTVQRVTANVRDAFDPNAVSFHPIEAPGRNPTVPGLYAPLTPSSVIYCTDCHASDTGPGAGGQGAAGPHGSTYPGILEREFSTGDNTPESPQAYALCYKCHDRNTLLSPTSLFPKHLTHVQQDNAPCSVCHDWHGISALQGNATNNAHLMNFDRSIVTPNAANQLLYTSTSPGHGTCSLSCHGTQHDNSPY